MSPFLQSRDVPFEIGGQAGMVDSRHSCGGYGSAGEQPERRHEAEDWAERSSLCSLVSAQSLAESDNLTGPPGSVCAMGRGILDGFSIEVATETFAPGMIWGRRFGSTDLSIQGLGIHDFCLAGGLMVDGVG